MARAHKTPTPDSATPVVQSVAQTEDVGEDNSFLLDVLETAVIDQGEQDSFLSFAEDSVAAGFDPEQLTFAEDDDRKEQVAPLPGLREKHADKEYGDYEGGVAFLQGEGDKNAVDPNDVAQGALGDCYLMAGMLAVARSNPQLIQDLIVDNGDGTFAVTLYIRDSWRSAPKKVITVIDARLPEKYKGTPLYAKTGDSEGESVELWPALIEKAVAQQKGSYEQISGGNIGKDGFKFAGATELLTGEKEDYLKTSSLDEDDALLHIAIALDDHQPCTCDSKNMEDEADLAKEALAYNVYGNHAYVPGDVDLDARTIDLNNPWGSHNVENLPVADFLRFYRSIRIGA